VTWERLTPPEVWDASEVSILSQHECELAEWQVELMNLAIAAHDLMYEWHTGAVEGWQPDVVDAVEAGAAVSAFASARWWERPSP
jgi:hypothetical protein